ncbi:hypothetical protein [Hugenholtzia roseola]|uniref:hypothetical protein n=1 Tax=Hugenholtzia roseola TaxID=1002 RepID=UPI000686A7A0|nr:hypothetical protein [Hugenholtzia roseola]
MNFVENLLARLFPNRSAVPILEETLLRSAKEQEAFEAWSKSERLKWLQSEVELAYHTKRQNEPNTFIEVHLFDTLPAQGFALTYHQDLSAAEFQYFFDFLKEKILLLKNQNLPYQLYTSQRRIEDLKTYVKTTEKHYLKPTFSGNFEKMHQLYGNILIEYIKINDKPSFIRLLANRFSDRNYEKPLPFDDLLYHLFH